MERKSPIVKNIATAGSAAAEHRHPAQQLGGVRPQHFSPDRIKHVLPVSPFLDQPRPLELPHMMRDSPLGHARDRAQLLAGALFFLPDRLEQRHPARIRQCFGHRVELTRRQCGLAFSSRHCLIPIKLSGRPVKGSHMKCYWSSWVETRRGWRTACSAAALSPARERRVLKERERVSVGILELDGPAAWRLGDGRQQLHAADDQPLGRRVDASLGETEHDLR